MTTKMNTNYAQGQSILIELQNDECFIGELRFVNKTKTRIELINVRDARSGESVSDVQIYFMADIRTIKLLSEQKELTDQNESYDSSKQKITDKEIKKIESLTRNLKFIYQADRSYHDALHDLSIQNEIVINLEPCTIMGRNTRAAILTMCTDKNVYIFDLLSLGQIFPDLRSILISKAPRKIVFDGRKLLDNLKFKFDIEIESVFDCLVAHISTGGDKQVLDLNKCINYYFDLPETLILDKDKNWYNRPLASDLKNIAAKKILYIYKIYDFLLHKKMLNNFYTVCCSFANKYAGISDAVEASSVMSTQNTSSLDAIGDFDLDFNINLDSLL